MSWMRYRPSKRGIFWMLMVLSVVALRLPPRVTDPLKHVVQLMVWAEHVVHHGARLGTAAVRGDDPVEKAAFENRALQNAVISRSAQIEQLRDENGRLAALRNTYIPITLPLLRADVVARDMAAWRDAVIVSRGSTRGVSPQDWVASRFFINHGLTSGLEPGQAVLAGEALIGRVEMVSPYMSRVQLLSDADAAPIEVRVGAVVDGNLEIADYVCSVRGHGRGEMLIADVPYGNVQVDRANADGPTPDEAVRRIQVGDSVYSAAGQFGIPVPMVVGSVAAIEENPRQRLVYNVIVKPVVAANDLDECYVIPAVPIGPLRLSDRQ